MDIKVLKAQGYSQRPVARDDEGAPGHSAPGVGRERAREVPAWPAGVEAGRLQGAPAVAPGEPTPDCGRHGFAGRSNVLLLGPGVGKTHLAIALGVKACQCGFSVYFTTLDDLVKNLTAADAAGKLKQKMRTYTHKSALLVVDLAG